MKFRCKAIACNASFCFKWALCNPCFCYGHKSRDVYTCPVKPCNIMEIKNALSDTASCVAEYSRMRCRSGKIRHIAQLCSVMCVLNLLNAIYECVCVCPQLEVVIGKA